MKRALVTLLVVLLLLGGCSSGMTITYHRVQLGSDERTLMVLVAKDAELDENPVALLDRLRRRPAEKLHVVVGRIGDRSFAAIDSGSGSSIVTQDGPGSPEIGPLLREVEQRLAVASSLEARTDLVVAKKILEGLPR